MAFGAAGPCEVATGRSGIAILGIRAGQPGALRTSSAAGRNFPATKAIRAIGPRRRCGSRPGTGWYAAQVSEDLAEILIGQPAEHLRWHADDTGPVGAYSPPDDAREVGIGVLAYGGGQIGRNQPCEEQVIYEDPALDLPPMTAPGTAANHREPTALDYRLRVAGHGDVYLRLSCRFGVGSALRAGRRPHWQRPAGGRPRKARCATSARCASMAESRGLGTWAARRVGVCLTNCASAAGHHARARTNPTFR